MDSRVVALDCCDALDFFFFFGVGSAAVGFVSLESVAVPVLSDEDSAGAVDDDSDPDVVDGSADATPCPKKTAAPIPRAAASPPIRPTYTPDRMNM
jgi:hypothetical protein